MRLFNSKSQFMIFQLATLILLLPLCPNCYADHTNGSRHSNCDPPGEADENPSWTANLNSVLSSLEANASINNGYFVADAGISTPDKAYGLIQCRGDISPPECRDCAGKAVRVANESCGKGNGEIIVGTQCFLRYSNESFYGVWEESIFYSSGSSSSGSDDATVVAKGLAMMARLAAAAPMEALMFAKSETDDDDGKGGKMYGLAQCTRDLARSDCGDCLDYLLKNTWTEITNKRCWKSFARGCFMVYDHHFNSSRSSVDPPAAAEGNRVWAGRFSAGITILMIALMAHI